MATRTDADRFEDLYRRHRAAVYRFLLRDLRNREDAEDATQTAFLQAYSAYARGSRPERPRAWLITIADNLRRRRFRADRAREALPLDEALVEAPAPDERVRGLRDALETLPFNQRAALVLREVAGLSYAEIARQLSLSVGSVQMLIFRARRTLRDELVTTARRATLFVPGWLSNALPGAERVATQLRVVGAAAVAAVAAAGVTSAEPARSPAPVAESLQRGATPVPAVPRPRASAADAATTVPAVRNDRSEARSEPIAPPTPEAAPATTAEATATAPARTAPAAAASPAVALPPLPPIPALPELAAPPALPPVPVPAPLPALPLPALPLDLPKGIEGAPDPQIDAVLAGR